MPQEMPLEVTEALNTSGITRIVVGHTPHGVSPTAIVCGAGGEGGVAAAAAHGSGGGFSGGDGGLSGLGGGGAGGSGAAGSVDRVGARALIVMADTSYSEMSAADNRGAAASEVTLDLVDGTTRVSNFAAYTVQRPTLHAAHCCCLICVLRVPCTAAVPCLTQRTAALEGIAQKTIALHVSHPLSNSLSPQLPHTPCTACAAGAWCTSRWIVHRLHPPPAQVTYRHGADWAA